MTPSFLGKRKSSAYDRRRYAEGSLLMARRYVSDAVKLTLDGDKEAHAAVSFALGALDDALDELEDEG